MSRIAKKAKRQNMVQTSVRLNEETLRTIRDIADERGVPQSEVLRAAVELYKHADALKPPSKLATIDETDKREEQDGESKKLYYRVKEIIFHEVGG